MVFTPDPDPYRPTNIRDDCISRQSSLHWRGVYLIRRTGTYLIGIKICIQLWKKPDCNQKILHSLWGFFFFGSLHVAMTYLQSVSLELRSVQCNGAISWTFGVPLSTMWSKPPKSRSSSLNQSPALLDVRESNVSIARWPVYKKKKKKIQRPTSTLFVFCNFQR